MKRLLCATAISLVSLAAVAGPGGAPVTVTNTPLPVTGTVTVGNTPSVTVTNSVLPVEVSNADPIPVVNSQATTPFDVRVRFDKDAGCLVGCTNFVKGDFSIKFDLAQVPAGKRWVITYVVGELPFYGASWLGWWLDVNEDWLIKAAYFGPYFDGQSGFSFRGFSTEVFTSFGPGEIPHIRMSADVGPGRGMRYLTLSGYLVDEAP